MNGAMKKINLLGLAAVLTSMSFSSLFAAEPLVIDDDKLSESIGDEIGDLVTKKMTTSSMVLVKQLVRKSAAIKLPTAKTEKLDSLYADRVGSVGIITSVYKCNHCPNWHSSGAATCWVLTEDGVMVTNYHVFMGKKHDGFGVLMQDGRVAAVTEILAANKEQDIAIFKVTGAEYKPLPLGDTPKVGGDVHIIAHPDSRFFTYTSGKVSRYYADRNKRKAYWMGVTAEYARGSSGGPVMDDAGNVIGMVASTNSIYYPSRKPAKGKRGPFQMVIRNCVPVDAIRNMITQPK